MPNFHNISDLLMHGLELKLTSSTCGNMWLKMELELVGKEKFPNLTC